MEQPQRAFVPHNVPIKDFKLLPVRAPAQIIGRNRELAGGHIALKAGSAILFNGSAGIGKSTLAAVLASAYTAQSTGGVLWFRMTEDDTELLLARVGRAYGVNALSSSEEEPEDRVSMIKALLERHRPLIVLDGMTDIDAVREFATGAAVGIPMIVMHERPAAGPWTPISLRPLTTEDGVQLLSKLSGVDDIAFDVDFENLARLLEGDPFSLELAGKYLAVNDATPLELHTALLEAIPPGTTRTDPQQTVLGVVFRKLPPAAQGVLLVLGVSFAGGASAELLSDMSGVNATTLVPVLRTLMARGLIAESTVYGQMYYSVHESTQAFIQRWLEMNGRLLTAQGRALQAIVAYVQRHARGEPTHHDRLAAEMDNIVDGTAYATAAHQESNVRALVQAIGQDAADFVTLRGFQNELAQMRKLLSLVIRAEPPLMGERVDLDAEPAPMMVIEAEPRQSPYDEAPVSLREPPGTHDEYVPSFDVESLEPSTSQANPVDALFAPSPLIWTPEPVEPTPALDDEAFDITDLPPLSDYSFLEQAPAADNKNDALEAALDRPFEPPSIEDAPNLDGVLADAEPDAEPVPVRQPFSIFGSSRAAEPTPPEIPEFEAEAIQRVEATEDSGLFKWHPEFTELDLLDTQTPPSIDMTTRARPVLSSEVEALDIVDDAALAAMSEEELEGHINAARTKADKRNLARYLEALGDQQAAHGKRNLAIISYSQSTEALRGVEDWGLIGRQMEKLGGVYHDVGQLKEAGMMFEQALTIYRRQRQTDSESRVLAALGDVYRDSDDVAKAQDHYEQARFLAHERGDTMTESVQYGRMADLNERRGDPTNAILNYRRGLALAFQAGDSELRALYAGHLGRLLLDDTRTLVQAEALLADALEYRPTDSYNQRLLKRAQQRIERLVASGTQLPEAVDIRQYGADALTKTPLPR